MTAKLTYENAMREICYILGFAMQLDGAPAFIYPGDAMEVITGQYASIKLVTQESDIQSAWDPLDYEAQVIARNILCDSIHKHDLQIGATLNITPAMWKLP